MIDELCGCLQWDWDIWETRINVVRNNFIFPFRVLVWKKEELIIKKMSVNWKLYFSIAFLNWCMVRELVSFHFQKKKEKTLGAGRKVAKVSVASCQWLVFDSFFISVQFQESVATCQPNLHSLSLIFLTWSIWDWVLLCELWLSYAWEQVLVDKRHTTAAPAPAPAPSPVPAHNRGNLFCSASPRWFTYGILHCILYWYQSINTILVDEILLNMVGTRARFNS